MPLLTSTVHVILFWPGRLAPASFFRIFGKGVLDGESIWFCSLVCSFLRGYANYNWSLDPKRTEHDMQQLNRDMSLEIHQERMQHYALYQGLFWGLVSLGSGLFALSDLRKLLPKKQGPAIEACRCWSSSGAPHVFRMPAAI
jgi:hypothetical protein